MWTAKPWCGQPWDACDFLIERLQISTVPNSRLSIVVTIDDAPDVDAQRWAVTFTGLSDVSIQRTGREASVPTGYSSEIRTCDLVAPMPDGRMQVLVTSSAFDFTLFAETATVQEISSTAIALDDSTAFGPIWPLRRFEAEAIADE